MKKQCIIVLCLLLLLTGCAADAPSTNATSAAGVWENDDVLGPIASWLKENCSFSISYQYMNLARYGISQETEQEYATDGSFRFVTTRRQWNYASNYEYTETKQFYYRYENGILVCYMQQNDEKPTRTVPSAAVLTEMQTSKAMLVGPDGLLPSYLEEACALEQNDETGYAEYSFRVPLDKLLEAGDTLLSVFVNNVFSITGVDPVCAADVNIVCKIEAEVDTMRPVKITYDFTELKPYVFSDGALSAEYAFDTDLMYLTYTFDHSLVETIPVPDALIP